MQQAISGGMMLTQRAHIPFSLIFATTILLCLSLGSLDARGELPLEFKDFEEISLESFTDMVIVTASKHEQRLSEAPAYVTVITSEMIEDYGFETVAEALQVVPGMYVNYDRSTYQLGVRGIAMQDDWNNRVLLLLNGHILKDQWIGSSVLGTSLASTARDIERIEVIRGPISSLYGSCAFFATINIITREPTSEGEFYLGARYAHHTDDRQTEFSFAKAFDGGASLSLAGSVENVKGARLFFPEYSNFELSMFQPDERGRNQYYLSVDDFTGGYTSGTDFMRAGRLFGRVRWKDWSLQGRYANAKKGTPTGSYGSLFDDKRNYIIGEYDFLELKFERAVKRSLDLMVRVYYDDYHLAKHISYNYYALYPLWGLQAPYLPGPVVGYMGCDDFWGGEIKLDWEPASWERVTLGAMYQDHQVEQHQGEMDSTFSHVERDRLAPEIRTIGFDFWDLYLQNEVKLGNEVSFMVAGNYSEKDYSEAFFAPKAAVVFTDSNLGILKGILGQAFRAPSIFEVTYDDGATQIGNSKLVDEKVNTAEIVYERYLQGGIRLSVTGYLGRAENLIALRQIQVGEPGHPGDPYLDVVYQHQNLEDIEFRGLEYGLEKHTKSGCRGFLNFGLQSVKDRETKESLPNSPRILANFGVSMPLWTRRVWSSILARYVDERKAYDGQVAKSYFTSDLWLHLRNMVPGLSIHAGVKNFWDTDIIDPIFDYYYPVVLLKQDGRRLILKVDYKVGI